MYGQALNLGFVWITKSRLPSTLVVLVFAADADSSIFEKKKRWIPTVDPLIGGHQQPFKGSPTTIPNKVTKELPGTQLFTQVSEWWNKPVVEHSYARSKQITIQQIQDERPSESGDLHVTRTIPQVIQIWIENNL